MKDLSWVLNMQSQIILKFPMLCWWLACLVVRHLRELFTIDLICYMLVICRCDVSKKFELQYTNQMTLFLTFVFSAIKSLNVGTPCVMISSFILGM